MNILDRIPKPFKSFYFVAGFLFVFWMLFFDSNDWFTQRRLTSKQRELEKQKEFYEEKIVEVKNEREALLTDDEQLEKLAREKYLMKKETEEVYIVVSDEK